MNLISRNLSGHVRNRRVQRRDLILRHVGFSDFHGFAEVNRLQSQLIVIKILGNRRLHRAENIGHEFVNAGCRKASGFLFVFLLLHLRQDLRRIDIYLPRVIFHKVDKVGVVGIIFGQNSFKQRNNVPRRTHIDCVFTDFNGVTLRQGKLLVVGKHLLHVADNRTVVIQRAEKDILSLDLKLRVNEDHVIARMRDLPARLPEAGKRVLAAPERPDFRAV